MLVFCVLFGFGVFVVDVFVGGVFSDLWVVEERGIVFVVFMVVFLLGLGFGFILGGFVFEGVGWCWIFWIMVIVLGVIIFVLIFLLYEMYELCLIEFWRRKVMKWVGVVKMMRLVLEEWKIFVDLMRYNL